MPAVSPAEPLDERLIETALRLLTEEGLDALTLRRIAREQGVSHNAPLRHFASHADMLSEVAARGFALLSETIEKSGAGLPPGSAPVRRLAAVSRAYVDIAVANPALFALMFRSGDLDVTNAAFMRESRSAFENVVRHVRAAQDSGWHASRDTRVLAGAIWSSVHGLAMLWSQGAFQGATGAAQLEDAVQTLLELAIGGSHETPGENPRRSP